VSLKGCPDDMQMLCKDDEYVILNGMVKNTTASPELIDCFVESVGQDAEIATTNLANDWHDKFMQNRVSFISTCSTYDYENLARYPDNYEGNSIQIKGTVLQTDVVYGSNVVLMDVGDGNIIYVDYSGKQVRDPEILKGDTISFYGTFLGLKTYLTVLGANNTVPYITALYSSINT
jgi:hypothetical protein